MYLSVKSMTVFKVSTEIIKTLNKEPFQWSVSLREPIITLKGILLVYRVVPNVETKFNQKSPRTLWFFVNPYPFSSPLREKTSRGAGWNKDEDSGLEIRMKRAKSLRTAIDGDEQAISLFIWDFCIWWSRGNSIESVPGPISTSRLGVGAVFTQS